DAASLPGRAAWIPAITVAVVGTITGLVVLVTGASNHELAGEKLFLPLTHLERTGAVPSEHGQAFVLPEDTRLEENHAYDMVMLANPRGHKLGKIIAGDNTVLLPVWGITEGASTVYLRHNDPAKAHPSFDLEIPCTAKTIERGGIKWLELRPVDPETDLAKLARVRNLDGPYVRLGDFPLRGLVMRSLGTRAGSEPVEHLSMVEGARDPDAPDNPTLRTIVTLGFAGPYVAGDEAPWAIVGAEGYAPELGALVHLRLSSPARGLELGYLNDYDKLSLPPWEFLAGAQTVILRHKEDPARDLRVPVQHEVKAGRLQFSSAVEGFAFKDLAKLESYEDRPYLLAPPYRFTAEVHGDTRLPAQFAGRRALIPSESYRDLSLRPEGLYRANPRDVLQSDMVGPVVDHDGAGVVASALARRLPRPVNLLLGVTGLVLAAGTIACWTRHGARAGAELLVNRSWLRIGVGLLLLGLLVVAVDLPLERLLGPADTAITAVLVLHALILVLLTPRLARQASK
ncbi:MAG: hypothetical protein KC636_27190, partial [Myxococcales bacterium]|nr:hypothetical protein [Myxococcales bacterium]